MHTIIQPQFESILSHLSKDGVLYGLTNQALSALSKGADDKLENLLNSYCRSFSIIEWNTDMQKLIDETTLFYLSCSKLSSLFIRIECNGNIFRENGAIFSQHWDHFITSLLDCSSLQSNIIFCFDHSTHYSEDLLEAFHQLREQIYPIKLLFECENHSWKTPNALKLFRGKKTNIVQRDMPDLAGFNFHIANFDKRNCYLRLLGRNKVNWFSTDKKLRYQYDYSKDELIQLASKINSFHLSYEKIFVIASNAPATNALSNILQLSKLHPSD